MLDIGLERILVFTYNGTYETGFYYYTEVKDFAIYNVSMFFSKMF